MNNLAEFQQGSDPTHPDGTVVEPVGRLITPLAGSQQTGEVNFQFEVSGSVALTAVRLVFNNDQYATVCTACPTTSDAGIVRLNPADYGVTGAGTVQVALWAFPVDGTTTDDWILLDNKAFEWQSGGLSSAPGTTTRVSVASDGRQGSGMSHTISISADGRFIAFESRTTDLVAGDSNGSRDIFVHDRQTGRTERVSVASDGTQGNSGSFRPSISADGRFIAFYSYATDLVAGDSNGSMDIFVHDRQARRTERVSVASDGRQGNDDSFNPSISADGRFIAFRSPANNLVAVDSNGSWDIFVHDRQTGRTERISGTQGSDRSNTSIISADGRFIAFSSGANNLVAGDSNRAEDIFVHDRQTGHTERVSVASDGTQGNSGSFRPSISADGRFIAFDSIATDLVAGDSNGFLDVFVHDRQTGRTERVSVANDGTQGGDRSFALSISADGRFIAFSSETNNLVAGDSNGSRDVFVHDRQIGRTERVSVASDGTQGGDRSYGSIISADGHFVAFTSSASNLVNDDTNGSEDVFVHELAW